MSKDKRSFKDYIKDLWSCQQAKLTCLLKRRVNTRASRELYLPKRVMLALIPGNPDMKEVLPVKWNDRSNSHLSLRNASFGS